MIFPRERIEEIQQAIERGDIGFLSSLIGERRPRGRRVINPRSALMVSAHRARHLNKLDELEADIAIINLEDGVAPELKRRALYAAMVFISNAPQETPFLVVRINPLQEGGREEIELLNSVYPDAIRIPKVRGRGEIEEGERIVAEPIELHISVETRGALENLISLRSPRLTTAYLGILDLLSDLKIPQRVLKISNPTIDHLLARFLVEGKIAGLTPIAPTYQEYRDLDGFRDWCRYQREMGYGGVGCISPDQVEIANRIFGPTKEELERALYIKERFEAMAAQGVTGFSDERYGFIDEPIYRDALNTLAKQD
ncbi:MAG: CoA ester lyase [Epsilonproteobacteria bacterium]|nr:CoA ester lyase [Campylobacterota bacterium]NPA57352.1 CoA ester lyase [Campylobacterota bacterium]